MHAATRFHFHPLGRDEEEEKEEKGPYEAKRLNPYGPLHVLNDRLGKMGDV